MNRLLVFLSIVAVLGVAPALPLLSSRGLAQTTGTINPSIPRNEPSHEGAPLCMPMGVTATGEIVFPWLCRGFVEQLRGASGKSPTPGESGLKPPAAEKPPFALEDRPPKSTEETAAKQPDSTRPSIPKPAPAEAAPLAKGDSKPESVEEKGARPPENTIPTIPKPAAKSAETAPLPHGERRRTRESDAGPRGCTHFRTYDPNSGTYRDYSGRVRACRW